MSSKGKVTAKVVLCGDAAVGKTTILQRILHKDVQISPGETMGAGFASVMYPYGNRSIQMNIWDTAGQERYRSLVSVYFKCADIAVFVFDYTSKRSFESIESWINAMNEHCGGAIPEYLLVCNKIDLFLNSQVSEDEINILCEKYKMKCVHVSADTGRGIDKAMDEIAALALKRAAESSTEMSNGIEPLDLDEGGSSGCC